MHSLQTSKCTRKLYPNVQWMLSLRIFEDDLRAWEHDQYSLHAGQCGMLYRNMVIRKRPSRNGRKTSCAACPVTELSDQILVCGRKRLPGRHHKAVNTFGHAFRWSLSSQCLTIARCSRLSISDPQVCLGGYDQQSSDSCCQTHTFQLNACFTQRLFAYQPLTFACFVGLQPFLRAHKGSLSSQKQCKNEI